MKTLLILLFLALVTSFYIPEKEFVDRDKDIQLYFITSEDHRTTIVYEYTINRDTIIPLAIPDHVISSLIVK